jgi:hypothetical protein
VVAVVVVVAVVSADAAIRATRRALALSLADLPPAAYREALADLPPRLAAEVRAVVAGECDGRIWDRIERAWAMSARGLAEAAYLSDAAECEKAERGAREDRERQARLDAWRAEHPTREGHVDAAEIKARWTAPYAVAEALGLLEGSRRQGGGLTVRCPAHGDKTPSCSITRAGGTLRVRCFGCGLAGDVFALVAAVRGLDVRRDFVQVKIEAGRLLC